MNLFLIHFIGEGQETLMQQLHFQEKIINQLKLENQLLKRERVSTQRVKSAPTSPIRRGTTTCM